MEDRLKDIKEVLHAKVYGPAISDVSWLVSEVERLRADREAVNDDLVRGAQAEAENAELIRKLKYHNDVLRALDVGAERITELKQELAGRGSDD